MFENILLFDSYFVKAKTKRAKCTFVSKPVFKIQF